MFQGIASGEGEARGGSGAPALPGQCRTRREGKVRKLTGLRGHLGKGFMNAPRRDMEFTGDLAD